MEIFALTISVLAFVISLASYFNFHRREVEKSQLSLVLGLLNDLQNIEINIRGCECDKNSTTDWLLYGGPLVGLKSSDINLPMVVADDFEPLLALASYLCNPILPARISQTFCQAFPARYSYAAFDNLPSKHVRIMDLLILDSKELRENYPRKVPSYYVSNMVSYIAFSSAVENTVNEIKDWLKSKHIKDLNVSN